MTSPADALAFLEEAVAETIYNIAASGWDRRGVLAKWQHVDGISKKRYLDEARAVLDLLLGTPDTPCPRCGGTGWIDFTKRTNYQDFRCSDCEGLGTLPGRPPLRMPCPTCGGDGKIHQAVMGGYGTVRTGTKTTTCGDCGGSGYSPLAAIDVARGIEQVGWVLREGASLGFRTRQLGGTATNEEPVYRFPAPDGTEHQQ